MAIPAVCLRRVGSHPSLVTASERAVRVTRADYDDMARLRMCVFGSAEDMIPDPDPNQGIGMSHVVWAPRVSNPLFPLKVPHRCLSLLFAVTSCVLARCACSRLALHVSRSLRNS